MERPKGSIDNADAKEDFVKSVYSAKNLFQNLKTSRGGNFMEPVRLLKER